MNAQDECSTRPVQRLERERREFIRAHHPDRGGDAGTFAIGLRELDQRRAALARPVRVTVVRRKRGLARLVEPLRTRVLRRAQPPRVK